MQRFEVTGTAPIVGADGVTVWSGQVELDETVTNIPALIEAGAVKPAKAAKTDDKPKE